MQKQFDFQGNLSTNDRTLQIMYTVYNSLEKVNNCVDVFLNIAKPFDTMDHKRLLHQLEIGMVSNSL